MKIFEIEELIKKYGEKANLIDVLNNEKGNYKYKCPKCEGKGILIETYNAYPTFLPDSGYVYKEGIREIKCDLCNSKGYTEKEYKPKMKTEIIGYE